MGQNKCYQNPWNASFCYFGIGVLILVFIIPQAYIQKVIMYFKPIPNFILSCINRIMEDRKGQENFQLIVITHDERFAQLIGQRQHAEKYYRVTKDEQ